TEPHALLGDLAEPGQAEDLEPAGVGEDWPRPVHEAMQPTVRSNHLRSGTQHQVEGVAKDDLRSEALQLLGCHGLYGAIGADGHECRGIDGAAREAQSSAPRPAIQCDELEDHSTPREP